MRALVERAANPQWTLFMVGVTNVGGVYLPVLIGITISIYFMYQKDWWNFISFFLVVGAGTVVQVLLKLFFHRPRPSPHFVMAYGYSFPSNHTFFAMVIYGFLNYVVWKRTKVKGLKICILLISTFLILLVGVSRVYLGVHWLTDILGAYVAGFAWLVFSVRVVRTIEEKSRASREP